MRSSHDAVSGATERSSLARDLGVREAGITPSREGDKE